MERSVNGMAGSVVEGAEREAGWPFAPPGPDDPRPGEIWQSYEGSRFEIMAVGLDVATRTPMVAYRCPESGQAWFRTLANFTEVVEAEGKAGMPVPYRRFGRVGRPKDDGTAVSQHGKWPTGYPPGSIAERRYRDEMEQSFESMGAALDNIRAICRDVAGVDAGSATESVRAVAARARKWAEYEAAFGIRIDASSRPDSSVWGGTEGWKDVGPAVSQDGKSDDLVSLLSTAGFRVDADHSVYDCVGELIDRGWERDRAVSQDGNPDPLESMYDAWVALQLVIARIETVACYHSAPDRVLGAILAGCDDVKAHLDAAMGDAEDAAGIEPGEPD